MTYTPSENSSTVDVYSVNTCTYARTHCRNEVIFDRDLTNFVLSWCLLIHSPHVADVRRQKKVLLDVAACRLMTHHVNTANDSQTKEFHLGQMYVGEVCSELQPLSRE